MTISKARGNTKYDVNKDPKTTQVCLGVSLVTHEMDHIVQDDRHVEIPVDDDITYITVDRALVEVKNESSIKYDVVADLLDTEGYRKSVWRITGIWECVPEDQHPF